MRLVDAHTHLYDMKSGYAPPPDILPVLVGYSHSSNRKAAELAEAHGYPYVLGIAPQTVVKKGAAQLEEWVGFIRSKKPSAIGEVGLDYKWASSMAQVEEQKAVFRRMLELSDAMGLPLVIHSRNNPNENGLPKEAVEDIISMAGGRRLLMHFYSGTAEQAERIVAAGGHISMGHIRSKERRKVINTVPLDRLLVESDCPYVGKTPDSIREALAYIAEVKGISAEEAAGATARNAAAFFGFVVE